MFNTDEAILDYAVKMSSTPSGICERIAEETKKKFSNSQMLIDPCVASFLGFLIEIAKAEEVLELGCYTGYSALAMAERLPPHGHVTTLDINIETTDFAKGFWEQSDHGKKINLLIGPAKESLEKLDQKFDLIFIDADKEAYPQYLEASLGLLSEKGIVVLDNVLRGGQVLDPEASGPGAMGIKKVNELIRERKDLYATLLPIRDGLFLVRPV